MDNNYENYFTDEEFDYQQPESEGILRKINKILSKMLDSIYNFVLFVIRKVNLFMKSATSKLRKYPEDKIIYDQYGILEIANSSSSMIDDYYLNILRINELDHQINKDINISDMLKDKIKDSAFRLRKEKTKRELYEAVEKRFQNCDYYCKNLERMYQKTQNPSKQEHPKPYKKSFIQHQINVEFPKKLKAMHVLGNNLEITKKIYKDSGLMYRASHKLDIQRNQKMLNHISFILNYTLKFKMLFEKVIDEAK